MAKLINCQCGQTVRGADEQEVLEQAEEHIRQHHPELVDTVTAEQLLAWIEDENTPHEQAVGA